MGGYIGTQPVPQATQTRDSFTATASQTSFATSGYTPSFLDVFLNGVHLLDGTDFTATNGSDVVLTTGAALGDVLEVVAYSTYEVNSQNYTGGLTVDNDGATVLTVDRATSDGTIIDVQKNGTSVGSIGVTQSGTNIYYAGGAAKSGVEYSNTAWRPWYDGARSDNVVDLGTTANRFKDAYLSGGVYLGGTAADNKLNDYETGSFTPTFTSTGTNPSGITYDPTVGNEGHYTKIGKVVHIQINIRTDAISNKGSGNLQVSGLPFVSSDYASQGGVAAFPCYSAGFLNTHPSYGLLAEAETTLSLVYRATSDGSTENVPTTALNTGSNDNLCRITGTYMTEE